SRRKSSKNCVRCPANLLAFQYLGSARDPQKLRSHVTALRNAIEAKKKLGLDESEVELFRTAWTWERAIYGERRLDEFKRAVRGDVEFLRKHLNYPPGLGSLWSRTVTARYSRTALLSELSRTRSPGALRMGQAAWWITKERWEEQNPPPKQSPLQ